MPDSDESCRIIRPASHTTALGELFIADEGERAQGGKFTDGDKFDTPVRDQSESCWGRSSGLQPEFLLADDWLCAMRIGCFELPLGLRGSLFIQPGSAFHPIGPLINILRYLVELTIEPSSFKHHLAPPISFVLRPAVDIRWVLQHFLFSHSFDLGR